MISEYKHGSSDDAQRRQALASKGAAVIPYLARIACERKLHFYFMNPKAGIFGWYHDYPYVPHAQSVLKEISDPGAIPNLIKIVLDLRLGTQAQEAVVRLQGAASPVPKELLVLIIKRDARNWLAVYTVNIERYAKLMQAYSPDEKADVLLFLLDPHKLAPGITFEGAQNIHNISALAKEAWLKIIQLLAETGSPIALQALKRQEASLVSALKEFERIAGTPRIMDQRTDAGRNHAAMDIDLTRQMLAAYRAALADFGKK